MTPTGAMNKGVGGRMPNSDTDRSRSVAPTSIRGTIPYREKASTLARWVLPVAGAAGDVEVHPRGQHLGPRTLQRSKINWVSR